jgi:hypothetical protein
MTEFSNNIKTAVEAHASEPRDDYDSDAPLPRLDLLLAAGYDHMDWPVIRLFGADDDPAAEARREEHRRAVFAELDRQSAARAREFRKRQAAERQRNICALIKQAEKATGKPVTAITLPDGTKLDFSKTEQQGNEVDKWIAKHACALAGNS